MFAPDSPPVVFEANHAALNVVPLGESKTTQVQFAAVVLFPPVGVADVCAVRTIAVVPSNESPTLLPSAAAAPPAEIAI